jgi:hypothetical protein
MAAPQGACFFLFGQFALASGSGTKNPINLASFRSAFLLFLPLDLWATAKGQRCDSYFPGNGESGPVERSTHALLGRKRLV